MTTVSAVVSTHESGFKAFAKRHPLTAYFTLAYALTWVLIIPIMFSQMGLGVLNLPEPLLFISLLLSTYSGPLPAALILTTLIEGREAADNSCGGCSNGAWDLAGICWCWSVTRSFF